MDCGLGNTHIRLIWPWISEGQRTLSRRHIALASQTSQLPKQPKSSYSQRSQLHLLIVAPPGSVLGSCGSEGVVR